MDKASALGLLGLEGNPGEGEIRAALARKKEDLASKKAAAPTDALRSKFEALEARLDDAARVLLAGSTENTQSSASRPSPLSQTKLADLPQGQQSYTGFDGADAAAQIHLQPGQVLASRYEIREHLASGGMGAVYRAYDRNRAEDIAIKIMLPALMQNERARERFLSEARLSSRLSHPNIVNVFDVQQDGDFYFLTMELLHGQDLRQVIENRKLARQAFSLDEVVEILVPVCSALEHAHQVTVHRDIKPENIWITEDQQIKLMDFGIAQLQSTSQRTRTGAAMGTAYYMAPEQLKGVKDVDGRADQYALAVLAYEMLTGEVPAGVIEPIQTLRRDMPKGIANAIMQAMSARPENRFADIRAFSEAIRSGKGVKRRIASNRKATARLPEGMNKWAIAAALLLVIGLGSALGTGVLDLSALLPESEEVIQARYQKTIRLQAEAKALVAQLKDAQRVMRDRERQIETDIDRLKASLRNARDKAEKKLLQSELASLEQDLAAQQAEARLAEVRLFSVLDARLEGDLAMADTLIRDKQYKPALEVLEPTTDALRNRGESLAVLPRTLSLESSYEKAADTWAEFSRGKRYCDARVVIPDDKLTALYHFDDTAQWCLRSRYVLKVLDKAQLASKTLLEQGRLLAYNTALEKTTELLEQMIVYDPGTARSIYESERRKAYQAQQAVLGYLDYTPLVHPALSGVVTQQRGVRIIPELALNLDTLMRLDWREGNESEQAVQHVQILKDDLIDYRRCDEAVFDGLLREAPGNNVALFNLLSLTAYCSPVETDWMTDWVIRQFSQLVTLVVAQGGPAEHVYLTQPLVGFIGEEEQLAAFWKGPSGQQNYEAMQAFVSQPMLPGNTRYEADLHTKMLLHRLNSLGDSDTPAEQFAADEALVTHLVRIFELREQLGFAGARRAFFAKNPEILVHHFLDTGQFERAAEVYRSWEPRCPAVTVPEDLEAAYGPESDQIIRPEGYRSLCLSEHFALIDRLAAQRPEYAGLAYRLYDIPVNHEKAVAPAYIQNFLREVEQVAWEASESGDLEASKFLAFLHAYGRVGLFDLPKDFHNPERGFALALKLAEAGKGDFERIVSIMYWNGAGTAKNINKALEWEEKYALKTGKAADFYSLARSYRDAKLYSKAMDYYRKAVEVDPDYWNAYFQMALLYYDGQGVKKDLAKAHEFFLKHARGDANAIGSLAWVAYNYYFGRGVTKDLEQARYWAQRLVDRGDNSAGQGQKLLDMLDK